MIRAGCGIALSVAVLSCCAPAQTQNINDSYKKWLECDVSWLISKAEVGPNFSLKMSFHRTSVVGTRISLNSLSMDGGVVATARTNSHGVASFNRIPPGTYDLDSPDGVLFPSGNILIDVKGGPSSAEKVELEWPSHSVATRSLRGKFTVSEQLTAPEIPLRNARIELRDVYSARLIETASTDANGDYEFATRDPGLYAVRLVLPKKGEAGVEKRELAVELDLAASEFSVPEMKVTQSDCAGIQLFRKSKTDDRWEEQ